MGKTETIMIFRIWIIIMTGILITSQAFCQDIPVIKKRYFKFDHRITREDYHQGKIFIKLKPEYKHSFLNQLKRDDFSSRVADHITLKKVKPLVTENQLNLHKARRSQPFNYDMSLYQMVSFDPAVPVDEAINLMYNTGMVEISEPVYRQKIDFVPNDDLIGRQYYLELVKAFEAWDITPGDTTVVVAIIDSGIQKNHPDLKANLWTNPDDPVDGIDNDNNGYVDDYQGWDFAGAQEEVEDDEDNNVNIKKGGGHAHGLEVAGVAGATPNNEIGFAGTGYNCRILATKHFADNQPEDELSYASSPYLGVIYAAMMGADVINCSWGSTFRSQINQDIMNFAALDMGALVVASSGNSGKEESHYPSDYENVLSVAAVDGQLKKSSFTTYGKGVDITAFGSGIPVLTYNKEYSSTQGTSFSSPMVAGAAGLVKSVYPELTGFQVGELLRVTANDTIYEVNSSPTFNYKLGKGLLDMENALTSQPPSIRMINFRLLNSEGKTPQLGEEAFLVANFKNFLWSTQGSLKITLTSRSTLLQVIDNFSVLGVIESGQVVSNVGNPFRVKIAENIPANLKVDLLFEFTDGFYQDYQFASVLLNPTFLNIEENTVSSTVAENGRIGYQDTEQDEGLGFVFDEKNMLFEMGVVMGNSADQISNNVRSTAAEYDADFVSQERIKDLSPGDFSSSEILGSFSDDSAGASANNVLVGFRSMVWKEKPNDQYFIIEYSIKNTGDSTLNDFHAGLYADWDISDQGRQDLALWSDDLSLGYIHNTDTAKKLYAGIQLLTEPANYWAVDNDHTIEDNPWGVYDGFTDSEKFESISSGIARDSAGFSSETGNDVSHAIASGPHIIAPGDSIVIAFAIHGASDPDDLFQSAYAADTTYNFTLREPVPDVAPVEVCYNQKAIITATGADSIKWYKTKTGGIAFFEGSQYETDHLLNDTVFYVSNAENSWESVRAPARVTVKANPEITLSGPTQLCEGDTLILIAKEADSYSWSPGGENTQSLIVTEAGNYSVEVRDSELGCVSRSDTVNVKKHPAPAAEFTVSQDSIIEDKDVALSFTDQSSNASFWLWELSTGEISRDQNASFNVNSSDPIKVALTVTTLDGCQDSTSQVINIIAGIEQSPLDRSWTLFPNPANSTLYYELVNDHYGPVTLSILTLTGRLIERHEFVKSAESLNGKLDLHAYPPGVYLIQLDQRRAGRSVKKIIVK